MNCPKCFRELKGSEICWCGLDTNPKPIINQGWQCPICESVYAPKVKECKYCNEPKINVTYCRIT